MLLSTACKEYDDIRTRITSEVKMLLSKMNLSNTQKIFENENVFTQFMIDPSSFNLDSDCRVNINDPMLNNLFKLSRYSFSMSLIILEKRNLSNLKTHS